MVNNQQTNLSQHSYVSIVFVEIFEQIVIISAGLVLLFMLVAINSLNLKVWHHKWNTFR